jgi:hypothetical protein
MCYLLSLSHLIILLLIVSNYNYLFFQLHPLSFDFYIKFIFLFYNISGLIVKVLISNLDSWFFYEILISFQFHHWIHNLIFIFFILGPHSLDFYFCFGFFCKFNFSFQFCLSIQIRMVFKVWPSMF